MSAPEDRIVLLIIAVSTLVDIGITIYYLSQGVSIVFQNIYYFTIVLAAYWFRWKGALFACALSLSYLALCLFYDQQFETVLQAFIRAIIFVVIAFVVAYLSIRLEEEKRRYHAIFSASGSGMVLVRRTDRHIEESNQRFLEITEQGSMEGKCIEEFFDRQAFDDIEAMLLRNEAVTDIEMTMNIRSGERRTCLISGSILGQRELVISVVDITERKRTHLSMEEANRKLNILTSITRHDTNNKLIILSGHLALHAETLNEAKEKKRVEMMSDIVDSLTEQLDFAENYRRLGVHAPEWQSVQKAGESAAAQFDRPDISITIESKDLEVLADPMLNKVFYNLIDNSLKHGGKITEIHITTAVNEKDALIIYQDNGVGIPLDKKDRLFQDGNGRDHGLGLYLIREILKITDIDIRERGTPGEGVKFELLVPHRAYRTEKV